MAELATVFAPWSANAAEMARDLGENETTVRNWRQRGSVPARHWPNIIKAAAARGHVLAAADFLPALHDVPSLSETNSAASDSLSGGNETEFTPTEEEPELPIAGSFAEPELPVIGVAA